MQKVHGKQKIKKKFSNETKGIERNTPQKKRNIHPKKNTNPKYNPKTQPFCFSKSNQKKKMKKKKGQK
jgi:hypothetical protein